MPQPSIKALSVFQLGKQVSVDTPVPATAKLRGNVTVPEWGVTRRNPGYDNGLLARHVDAGTIVDRMAEGSVETTLSFEQVLYPLLAGVKGGVTPTQPDAPGSADIYLWEFAPPVAADPAVNMFTLEWRRTEGTTPYDREIENVVASEIRVGAEGGANLATLGWNFFGKRVNTSTLTAALTEPVCEYAPAQMFKIYKDTAWADLGTTQLTDSVVSFDFTYRTGIVAQRTLDGFLGITGYSAGNFGADVHRASLRMTLKYHSVADAWRTDYENGTVRFVRLEVAGSTPAGNLLGKFFRIDGAWVVMEMRPIADRDGYHIVDVLLESVYDPTEAQDVAIAAQNTLATLP